MRDPCGRPAADDHGGEAGGGAEGEGWVMIGVEHLAAVGRPAFLPAAEVWDREDIRCGSGASAAGCGPPRLRGATAGAPAQRAGGPAGSAGVAGVVPRSGAYGMM
jgi:hypothetical protein